MLAKYNCAGGVDQTGEVLFWPIQLARSSFNQVSRVRYLAGLQGIVNSFGNRMLRAYYL